MKQYKVCVIGCGVICENHLRPLSEMENITIVGVCDILPERAERMAEKYHCPAYTDYRVLLAEQKPDAAHLCLPHYLHSVVAVYCLEHGVDVLSEKPMDAHYEGALAMAEAAERTGRKLGVIFQNRYNAGSVLAKRTVECGKYGKLLSLSGLVMWHRDEAYYKDGEWRKSYETSGGGVIINQAIHTLDLMRWLASSTPKTVSATVSHHGDTTAEVEDTTEGVITFENGAKCLYYFSINNGQDDCIRVNATLEGASIEIIGGRCRVQYADGTEEWDTPSANSFTGAKAVYGTSHGTQIEEFYREGAEEAVRQTMREALLTQELIHKIFAAAGKPQK